MVAEGAPLCHQVSSVLAAHMRAKQSKANAYSQTDTDTVVTGAGQTVGLQTRPAVPSEAPALGIPAFSSVCSSDLRRARQGHSKGISSLTNSKCATGPEHDHKNNLKVRQTSIWSSRRRRLSTTVPQATAQALADQSITLHLRVANPSTSDVSSPAEDMGGPTVVAAKPMFAFQPRPNVAKSKAVRMAKAAAQSMFMGPIKLLLVSLVIAPARAEALALHNRYARYPPCPYSPLPPPPPTPQKSANRVAELLRDCRMPQMRLSRGHASSVVAQQLGQAHKRGPVRVFHQIALQLFRERLQGARRFRVARFVVAALQPCVIEDGVASQNLPDLDTIRRLCRIQIRGSRPC